MSDDEKRRDALAVFVVGYIHGRSSLDNHDAVGRQAEAAFNKWWTERQERESVKLNVIEAAVLATVRRNPGITIAAVQSEVRSTFNTSGADAVRTLRLCRLIELRSGFSLYPVTT